jgi:hypothetical protein
MASKRYFLPLVLVLSLLCVSGSRKAKTLVSFHVEAEQAVAEVDPQGKFILPLILGNPPTTYYFQKVPEITSKQVEGFYAFPSRTGEGFGAAFKLDPQGRNRLQSLTSLNSGKRLLTTVNTRPVNFVVIDRAISHGYIVVWSGLTAEDIISFRESMTEIVPSTPTAEGDAWNDVGSSGPTSGDAPNGGAKKRGFFGRLFKGKDKGPETKENGANGSLDDFALPAS